MNCPRCDEEVILGAERCEKCGAPLDLLEAEPDAKMTRADPAVFAKPVFSAPAARGPASQEVLPWSVHEDFSPKTPMSFAGGLLILLGGMISMVNGFLILNASRFVPRIFGLGDFSLTPVCGTLMLMLGLGAVMGGMLGVFRRQWAVVMAASVLCVISIGWSFVSMVLGSMGLLLVAMSKDDFD